MKKCANCGYEFEGKFCPNCGTEWQEEKICPECGAKLVGSAKFCNECGYSFFKTKRKKKSINIKENFAPIFQWLKKHLKIVILIVVAVASVIILGCSIPACIANKNNGTYYKLNYDGTLNNKTYFILKSGKWTDEDGESGTYKTKGDKIIFYYTLFGETEELCEGTLSSHVLKVNGGTFISEKHKHKYGGWETTKEPTCTVDGVETRTCACGVKETQPIKKLGHYMKWVVTQEPTCAEDGSQTYICSRCKEESETQPIEKLGHDWKWVVTKKPNCTEDGSQTYTCSRCKEKSETQTIEKLGHTLPTAWTFDNTHHWKICTVCNASIERAEHNGEDSCTTCKYRYGDTIGLSFTLNANEYTVSDLGYAKDLDIVIPAKYNGLPVTSIGDYAFYDCTSLKSITIPASITFIDDYAFSGCTSLTSIVIPESVTEIGDYAFYRCTSLTNITISGSVTSIGQSAFAYCHALTSVTIPTGVTSIGSFAFSRCTSLASVVISNSVTVIDYCTFYGCTALTIYCEAEEKPSGWDKGWNYSDCPVVWGYKG